MRRWWCETWVLLRWLTSVSPEDSARGRLFPTTESWTSGGREPARSSDDPEAPVHRVGVRVAEEAVRALLEPEDVALRPRKTHRRQHPVQSRPAQVEVVDRRPVTDHEAIGQAFLQLGHLLAVQREVDREAGADRALHRLRSGRGL